MLKQKIVINMKNLKSILLAGFLTVGTFASTIMTSCNPDACKDVVCNNGGTCTDGTCSCPSGFEGANCDTESRTKLIGAYLLSGTDSDGGTYTNVNASTSTSSASKTKFIFAVPLAALSLTCTMTSSSAFTIDNVTLSGSTYTGNGTFNGTTMTITINETSASGSTIYNWSGNKQ